VTRRAVVVWCGLLLLAILNGGLRDIVLSPRLGDVGGRALSTLLLSGLILLITWLTIRWMRPEAFGEALGIGILWLALTLSFEFLVGHYGFGKSWSDLLADYDLRRGRIWVLVLVVTLVAPLWSAHARGTLARSAPRTGRDA
jgi:hypothetical protein